MAAIADLPMSRSPGATTALRVASIARVLLILFPMCALARSPLGVWATKNDRAHVRITRCGKSLCGAIVWLKQPLRNGRPKIDRHNPSPRLRARPLVGLRILTGFKAAAHSRDRWVDGSIYDPGSGKTYHSTIMLEPGGMLGVRGYIGWSVFGRTETWTRVRDRRGSEAPRKRS